MARVLAAHRYEVAKKPLQGEYTDEDQDFDQGAQSNLTIRLFFINQRWQMF